MFFSDELLTQILIGYFTLWVLAVVFLRAWIVWRKTQVFPIIYERSNTARGFLARYVLLLVALACANVVIFASFREYYGWLVPFPFLESSILRLVGLGIMVAGLIIVFFAQAQMGASWRIGIDQEHKTSLVNRGLFQISRNPIYLGLLATVIGFFFVLPNALTLLVLTQAWLAIQIQIRLEEEFLSNLHGQAYLEYRSSVRRWI